VTLKAENARLREENANLRDLQWRTLTSYGAVLGWLAAVLVEREREQREEGRLRAA
jgi:hypothetical protein